MRQFLIILFLLIIFSCKDEVPDFTIFDLTKVDGGCHDLGNGFSIPSDQVVGGGVGKDGIPSIDNPQFITVGQVDFLTDDELVLGIKIGDEVKLFPHRIMDKHEVANDEISGYPVTVTFCPLTGTGIIWPRPPDTTYGVSGFLYNSNLIAYDRKTDSYFSQMFSIGITGPNMCKSTGHIQAIETTWETWKTWFPESQILSTQTGFIRNYESLPYSKTQQETSLPDFPVNNVDERLPNYRRVFGIVISNQAKVFDINDFSEKGKLISDFFNGRPLVVVGNSKQNFVVAFYPQLNGSKVTMQFEDGNLTDDTGNLYNIFGEVVEGPDTGARLESPPYYTGYWFAWAAFYPELELYSDGSITN